MPRVYNCGKSVDEWCKQTGNGSATADICADCAEGFSCDFPTLEPDLDNGDNGVYRVKRENSKITIDHAPDGNLDGPWKSVDIEQIKKHNAYWKDDAIVKAVIEANAQFNK